MNTNATGLTDPGVPATESGLVPCKKEAHICKKDKEMKHLVNLKPNVKNGIKFDIKNSLLNCMSRPQPNWNNTNPWDSNNTVCRGPVNPKYGDPHALVYTPLWDPRGNDESANGAGGFPLPGCQQLISNNCRRSIHECTDYNNQWGGISDGPGYKHPVTHVFSPEEASDLGAPGKMPTKYYRYKMAKRLSGDELIHKGRFEPENRKDIVIVRTSTYKEEKEDEDEEGGKEKIQYHYHKIADEDQRWALTTNPDPPMKVEGYAFETIENKEHPDLRRIKTYRITELGSEAKNNPSVNGFVIVDPSDFFDLRLYMDGGKYDANYRRKDKNGDPKTFETCPIVGIKGFGGICDPTGKAGCNLPIYGIGPKTTFKDADGKSYSYEDYPVIWSGYAKKWAFIKVEQYLQNTNGRIGYKGGKLYANNYDLNDGPVLMLHRGRDFCDQREMYSGKVNPKQAPDLPCIQLSNTKI